jgi:hypothetical protein
MSRRRYVANLEMVVNIDITHKCPTIAMTAMVKEGYRIIKRRNQKIDLRSKHNLKTRIDLVHNSSVGKFRPVTASLSHDIRDLHLVGDIWRVDKQVNVHAFADVPGNMTVEGPDTPVVKLDLDNKEAIRLDKLSITALRIIRVGDGDAIPSSDALVEDLHVEAVNVHGI